MGFKRIFAWFSSIFATPEPKTNADPHPAARPLTTTERATSVRAIPLKRTTSVPADWVPISLPQIDLSHVNAREVASGETEGATYEVDLAAVRCTCPDFLKHRSQLPPDSIGRLCKHLGSELRRYVTTTDDELTAAILREYRKKISYFRVTLPSGSQIGLGIDPESAWVDVFARKCRKGERAGGCTGDYDSFGFNQAAKGWSYGSGPVGASEIRVALEQLKS